MYEIKTNRKISEITRKLGGKQKTETKIPKTQCAKDNVERKLFYTVEEIFKLVRTFDQKSNRQK